MGNVIHVITWITGWRPLNDRPELRVAVWLQRLQLVCAGLACCL